MSAAACGLVVVLRLRRRRRPSDAAVVCIRKKRIHTTTNQTVGITTMNRLISPTDPSIRVLSFDTEGNVATVNAKRYDLVGEDVARLFRNGYMSSIESVAVIINREGELERDNDGDLVFTGDITLMIHRFSLRGEAMPVINIVASPQPRR